MKKGFEVFDHIKFTVLDVLRGVDSIAIHYQGITGTHVAEVLFFDIRMPGLSGLELQKMLVARKVALLERAGYPDLEEHRHQHHQHMVAQQVDLDIGDFVWTGGDCHLYNNHFEQVETQLAREPLPLPKLVIKRKPDSIFDYQYEDFEIVGYQSHPAIKAPVAV